MKFEVLVMMAARAELGLEMIFPDIDIISRSRVVSREIELLIVSPDVGLLRNVIQYLQFPCRNLKMDILVDSRNFSSPFPCNKY